MQYLIISILYSIFKIGQSSTGAMGLFSSGCRILKEGWLSSSKNAFTAETPCKNKSRNIISREVTTELALNHLLALFQAANIILLWKDDGPHVLSLREKAVTWHTNSYSMSSAGGEIAHTALAAMCPYFKQPMKWNLNTKTNSKLIKKWIAYPRLSQT